MPKRKYNRAMRVYHIPVNEYTQNTMRIFKLFRPDLKKNQQVMEYALNLFYDKFDDMFMFEYNDLECIDKMYDKKVAYQYTYQFHRSIPEQINLVNKKMRTNINKPEFFRRILMHLFYCYGLYNPQKPHPLLQEEPANLEEFIKELEPEIQREILTAWEAEELENTKENIDDKTLEKEHEDDKTLEIENLDDKTEIDENLDDIYSIQEDYDLYKWEE